MNIDAYCSTCIRYLKSDSLCLDCLRETLLRFDNIKRPSAFKLQDEEGVGK